jgi:cell division protein FtsW
MNIKAMPWPNTAGARLLPLRENTLDVDMLLLTLTLLLAAFGILMVMSASLAMAEVHYGSPWHFGFRQLFFVGVGLVFLFVFLCLPLYIFEKLAIFFYFAAIILLLLVFVPGLGKTVNGSTRWLNLGFFNLQVSELGRLFLFIYFAQWLTRYRDALRQSWGLFFKGLLLMLLPAALIVIEPDLGATAVLVTVTFILLFLAGGRLGIFILMGLAALSALTALIVTSPYRLERLLSFLNPWADAQGSGYQLVQSLLAIGSGGVTGQGLGASLQKLFYLPEAHTDFIFAIVVEELGFLALVFLASLYFLLFIRILWIATVAERLERHFAAFLAYAIAFWLGLQAFISMAVNMGLLPTKGLTLPLISYGGSSVLVTLMALGLVLRVHRENCEAYRQRLKQRVRRC